MQWWLAELDRYGNPKLCDGAYTERERGKGEVETLTRYTVLTKDECADWLRISERQVERKLRPSFWVGDRSPRYQVEDVLKQLKEEAA